MVFKSAQHRKTAATWPGSLICAGILLILACRAQAVFLSAAAAAPFYAAELGPLYHPADLQRIYWAHLLIERYFAAVEPEQRHGIVSQLQATQLDPGLLGRISRIRLGWPNLRPGVYYVNEKAGPYAAKYFLGVPNGYRRIVSRPLVVKLPDANAFLIDPPPSADRIAQIYSGWINDELAAHPGALVLMPLLKLAELYGPSYKGMNSVMQPILNVAGKANIDPARVYLIGYSMAAHAVWNIALHYPTYLAAVNPLAGGADAQWQRLRLINLRNVLPVVWADADDPVEPVRQSRDLVQLLRGLKLDVQYEETQGGGHLPPPQTVEAQYQKLLARTRDLYPRRVSIESDRPDSLFNRADWIQVYEELESGPDRTLYLQHGSGVIHLNQNAFGLDALLDENTVRMSTTNVESVRLYFNEQMVDFSKPVVVIANGREVFRGLLNPSIDEMLKDELFLGRGWRYFTAILDLDLTESAPASRPSASSSTSSAATRPHGKITVYNPDGSIQRVIESP